MADLVKILLLAVLQGVTEFLPVSSSGHLVLAGHWLGVESPGSTLEVFLHAGTLVAIVCFYRARLVSLVQGVILRERKAFSDLGKLGFSTLPALFFFLLAGSAIKTSFEDVRRVGPALCVTGLLLLLARLGRRRPPRPEGTICLQDAWVMGLAQALALLPGISRSGSTISAACLRRVEGRTAAEFSFVMSIPLLFGATILETVKVFRGQGTGLPLPHLLIGAAVSGVVGYVALMLLVRMLARGCFWTFGIYCMALGIVSTIWAWT